MAKHPIPVVRMILKKNRRILILQRANTSHKSGCWNLPGGKIDFGDSVEGTCRKELKEETKLELIACRFLGYQDTLPPAGVQKHFLNLYFEVKYSGEISLNEESSDHRWISEDELDSYNIVFGNKEFLSYFFQTYIDKHKI